MTDFSQERLLGILTRAPGAFWRHDIDISLDAAAAMARFEHVAGVQATYYVLPTAEHYNPFSRHAAWVLNSIRSHGHRLGVHVDTRDRDPHQSVDDARRLLYSAYPDLFDLHKVSFHMPAADVLWKDYEGFDSAYSARWEGRYLSDSRREWDDAKEALITGEHQINLHAEHWFA